MTSTAMPVWGLTLIVVAGGALAIAGTMVAFNWKDIGHRTFRSSRDYLPSWYRRRGEGVFRLWIGGGAAVFGVLMAVAGVVGLAH